MRALPIPEGGALRFNNNLHKNFILPALPIRAKFPIILVYFLYFRCLRTLEAAGGKPIAGVSYHESGFVELQEGEAYAPLRKQ